MNNKDDTTELRMDIPNALMSVYDGVSLAQRLTRNQLILRVLSDYADARVHEATVLARVMNINPKRPEDAGRERGA